MCSTTFKEHRPSLETLEADTQPPKQITCPVDGCGKVFSNSSHLALHKAKVHGIGTDHLMPRDKSNIPSHFHCPVYGCYFHKDRFFANYKLLKRHYRGIHGEKNFLCSKCQKGFALDHARKRHEMSCGVIFHCKTCNCPYTTKEAVYMHCTRQRHELPDVVKETMKRFATEKLKPSPPKQAPSMQTDNNKPDNVTQPCVIFVSRMEPQIDISLVGRKILPKPVINSVIPMTKVTVRPDKISIEKFSFPSTQTAEIQTDIFGVSRPLEQPIIKKQIERLQMMKNVTQSSTATQVSLGKSQLSFPSSVTLSTGMQTNLSVLPKKNRHCSIAGTQTSGDYILKSAMAFADIPIHNHNGENEISKTPRSRSRISKRQSMKTSEVQTRETFPPRKRRRRRNLSRQAGCNTDGNLPALTYVSSAANTEQMLIDIMASTSTQTLKSYLEESGHHGRTDTQPVQNSQTQTSLSTLFKDMRESFLIADNATIMTDLGIAFKDTTEQSPVGPHQGRAVTIETQCGPDSSETSSGPSVDRSGHKDHYLPVVESPSFLDLLSDVPIPQAVSSTSKEISTITDQVPLPKQIGADMSVYTSIAVDFGVQTCSFPLENESESLLNISKWNPCLSSTAAKDMHTQTMMPRSSDFGMQTSRLQSLDFLVDPSMEVQGYMEGQGHMLCGGSATDMHTQTADDLLDFLMTNMETQTDVPFTYGLGPSDIQTQTQTEDIVSIDSVVVTTETQTNMQSLVNDEDDLTLSTDMQTQTQFAVAEFASNDFTDSHTQTNFDLFSL